MGGNTLLWGGRFSDFFRYKVRAFLTKSPTKFGLFIYKLLTIIFNLSPRRVGGGFGNSKFRMQNAKLKINEKDSLSTFPILLARVE